MDTTPNSSGDWWETKLNENKIEMNENDSENILSLNIKCTNGHLKGICNERLMNGFHSPQTFVGQSYF